MAGFRYDRGGIYPSELSDEDLASIACPTLVLLGDKEMIYDPVAAIARARRLTPGSIPRSCRMSGTCSGCSGPES